MNGSNKTAKEEIRLRVLRLLEEDSKLSQRDISDKLGVSLGSVNYCVRALVEKGWLKVNNFRRSDNKMGYAYVLTPQGCAQRALATKHFLSRKLQEYEQLKMEIALLESELTETESIMSDQR